MVGIIWANVIFEGMNSMMAYRTDGTPEQVTKVDNEVWGNVVDGVINIPWSEDLRWHGVTRYIGDMFELLGQRDACGILRDL